MRTLLLTFMLLILSGSLFSQTDNIEDTAIQKKCSEAGILDTTRFMHDNSSLLKRKNAMSFPWELAETISHRTPHQKNDPIWILQLLCRTDNETPIDPQQAVGLAYGAWKADTVLFLNLCDYGFTTAGWEWCVARDYDTFDLQYNASLKALSGKLNPSVASQLSIASDAATKYIGWHVAHEEGLGGTGYPGFCMEEEIEERGKFMGTVNDVYTGAKLSDWPPSVKADSLLNVVYKQALKQVVEEDPAFQPGAATEEYVRESERLWLVYRNTAADLFHALQPKTPVTQWRNWLTHYRIEQLKHLDEEGQQN